MKRDSPAAALAKRRPAAVTRGAAEGRPAPFQQSSPMKHLPHVHTSPDAIYPFDARGVAKRFRHAAIFGALDALTGGERMRFVNDHDPLPLLQQLSERYGEKLRIEYLQREPGAIVIDFIRQ